MQGGKRVKDCASPFRESWIRAWRPWTETI